MRYLEDQYYKLMTGLLINVNYFSQPRFDNLMFKESQDLEVMAMRIQVEKPDKGFSKIEVEGELDFFSSPELRKVISSILNDCKEGILVDLSKVNYIDSSGIATLIEAVHKSNERGISLHLTTIGPSVEQAFDILSLKEFFSRISIIQN